MHCKSRYAGLNIPYCFKIRNKSCTDLGIVYFFTQYIVKSTSIFHCSNTGRKMYKPKNIQKDIFIGLLFIAGIFGFISGEFIISTVLFAMASIFSNMGTDNQLRAQSFHVIPPCCLSSFVCTAYSTTPLISYKFGGFFCLKLSLCSQNIEKVDMYTSKLSLPVTCISFGEIDGYGIGVTISSLFFLNC